MPQLALQAGKGLPLQGVDHGDGEPGGQGLAQVLDGGGPVLGHQVGLGQVEVRARDLAPRGRPLPEDRFEVPDRPIAPVLRQVDGRSRRQQGWRGAAG